MMTVSILAQIQTGNSNLDYFINTLLPIVGPIGIILLGLIALALYVIKTTTDAKVSQIKEDTKRDSLISDLAGKSTMYADDIAKLRETVAEERGARNLLSEQLGNERKERLEERETLKNLIRDVSDKLKSHEARIEELTNELNGKKEEIKALRLERDLLNTQLKDKDVRVMALEKDIEALQLSKKQLVQKADEQSAQIAILAKQLSELDKTIFDAPPPSQVTVATASETITHTTITEELKEFQKKDEDNETPKS